MRKRTVPLYSCTIGAEVSNAAEVALANAPVDDEPVTAGEAIAIEQGERDVEAGRVVTADQVRRALPIVTVHYTNRASICGAEHVACSREISEVSR